MSRLGWNAALVAMVGILAVSTGCSGAVGDADTQGSDLPAVDDAAGEGTACTPSCLGKACGNDGCGGTCGNCPNGFLCTTDGKCGCIPQCEGKVCGNDGCGSTCGDCGAAEQCNAAGQCECKPKCEGKNCGDNGCGGVCGDCEDGSKCIAGVCQCQPACSGKECGPDGCGSLCGECEDWEECVAGKCACEPDCADKECGDDGCNGTCGTCAEGVECQEGKCGCTPSCEGKECGDDGCGGSCGTCSDECPVLGVCDLGLCKPACVPDCAGKVCGDDGCGCSCGNCPEEAPFCVLGECVAECTPECTNKACGDDGCGGSCGDCKQDEVCLDFVCEKSCPESDCDPMATSCTEDGLGYVTCLSLGFPCPDSWAWTETVTPCDAGWACKEGICECVPACDAAVCGADGCQGYCGYCGAGFVCTDGVCVEGGPPTLTITGMLPDTALAGEPVQVQFDVQGAEVLPGSEIGIWCFIDGNEAGSTQELSLELKALPLGLHQICCQITELGAPLSDCEATDCLTFKGIGPCDAPGDKACDDANPCSSDACVSIGDGKFECHYGKNPGQGCCTSDFDCGCKDSQWTVCVQETNQCFACNPAQCDDGNPCTTEECVDDVCVNTPVKDCCLTDDECDDGVACTVDACPDNKCVHSPNNAACDDGVACTDDACVDGACKSTLDDSACDDGNLCTTDSCDLANDCQHLPTNDGAACPDADKCNGDEACKAGICQAGKALDCDDKNPCTTDSCDPATGCAHAADLQGTCDDANVCNGTESCVDGQCKAGSALDCDDNAPCTTDSCDPAAGCKNTNVQDGTGCPDADKCNGDEKCQAGQCKAGTPLVCNDNKPCTDDSCEPATGCVFAPDDKNGCSDGKPCNGIEACKAGECKPGAPPDCADTNSCTADACVDPTGCTHTKLPDNTPCPGGAQYSCLSGECVCKPACTGKDCGSDGCGATCGTCPAGKACNNSLGKCEDLYTCADMMLCAQACNFVPLCLMGCYGQGSPASKALLDNFTNCVLVQCGINATPTCIAAATVGACKASYDACMADL